MNSWSKDLKQTLSKGDQVIIVACDPAISQMYQYIGKEAEIKEFFCWNGPDEWYILKDSPYAWNLDWLEPINNQNISIDQNDILNMFGE